MTAAHINDAATAYLNTLKQVGSGSAKPAGSDMIEGGMGSFGDVLEKSLAGAIEAQHKSEKISAQSLLGETDMTQVLQAVNNAEIALSSVLAIRDRVIAAYQEVLQTPV
jgi:flagellar hook-basal body complex protein FliE